VSNKNSVLIGLLSLIFIVTIFYALHYDSKKIGHELPLGIKISADKSIGQAYTTWLEQEESSVWKELTTKINLSYESCNRLKNQWYEDYKKGESALIKKEGKDQTISKATHDCINTILQDFGLSTQKIPLVSWVDNSAAAATDTMLFINEREFRKLSYEAQKFIIGHEIQHFLYKDCSTNYVLKRFFKGAQQSLPKEHPINKLSRFQELRADIKSALKGTDYTKGYIEFMEILSKKRENNGITHPKNSLRLSMGKTLMGNFI
jgi:hypothetical protein